MSDNGKPRLADAATRIITALLAAMPADAIERAAAKLRENDVDLTDTRKRLHEAEAREYRHTPIAHFVVIGPGEWARADTLHEAVDACVKRLGGQRKYKGKPLQVFGSNEPLELFAGDFGPRVKAKLDAALIQFIINA